MTKRATPPSGKKCHRARTTPALASALLLSLGVVAAAPAAALAQQADSAAAGSDRPFFTRADAITLGAFTLATAAITPLDRPLARWFQRPGSQGNRIVRGSAAVVRELASPGTVLIGGTLYAVGRIGGNERMATLGLHGTEAVLIGAGIVGVTKIVAGRARPYVTADSNPRLFRPFRGVRDTRYRSFPSGHSVMAFAAAAAVTGETARWWPDATPYIGTAMYGGAALAGVSRIYNDRHWASDVLVGAAVGTVVGQKVVRYHRSHPRNRVDRWFLSVNVTPAAGGGRQVRLGLVPGRE